MRRSWFKDIYISNVPKARPYKIANLIFGHTATYKLLVINYNQ